MLINGCVCKGETVAMNGPDFACGDGGRQAQLPTPKKSAVAAIRSGVQ